MVHICLEPRWEAKQKKEEPGVDWSIDEGTSKMRRLDGSMVTLAKGQPGISEGEVIPLSTVGVASSPQGENRTSHP